MRYNNVLHIKGIYNHFKQAIVNLNLQQISIFCIFRNCKHLFENILTKIHGIDTAVVKTQNFDDKDNADFLTEDGQLKYDLSVEA